MSPQRLALLLILARLAVSGPEPPSGGKCTYTFIVPQQKFTGAVCWSSVRSSPEPPGPNRSEVQELRDQLRRQQAQMEELHQLVEVDGAVVSEVKALRKESRSVNARITQLYAQLLHEILQRRQRPVPTAHLEGRVANASAEALRVAIGYRQLESKYQALAALVNNQSILIGQLERECQQGMGSRGRQQVPTYHTVPTTTPGHPQAPLPASPVQALAGRGEGPVPHAPLVLLPPPAPCTHSPLPLPQLGFGNLDGEHWLGLETISLLARQGRYALRVLLEDWSGRWAQAEYESFTLEPESDFYRLQLGHYRGTAGDSLSWHSGRQFSTLDRDRDAYSGNCAHYQKGGWWYNMCAHSNLNGVWYKGGHYRSRYQDGVYWAEFRGGAYSLRTVAMMIRPNPPALAP
uniref:Fibrinogen C-terminal domain-containing protein n=1 Tax=Sphenodon punctatus TaxID=8508 RepID=A0A8D0GZK1_SPHPU